MKRTAFCILLGFQMACSAALPSLGHTLERERVNLFKLIENTTSDGSKSFRIRGMSNGSLGVCGKPKTKFKNGILSVEIPKVLMSKGLKASQCFDLTINTPATVKQVVFGKNREEIWPVDKGKLQLTAEEEEAQELATRDLLEKHPDADLRDYSIQIFRETATVVCVTFFEWRDGELSRAHKYAIDIPRKTILGQREVSLAP